MTKRNMDIPGAKRMIVSLSVASTIGLWAIFARIEKNASAETIDTSQDDSGLQPEEAQTETVISLPPIPTLVPSLMSNSLVMAGGQTGNTLAPTPSGIVLPTPSGLLWKPPSDPQGGKGGNPGGGKAKPNKPGKQKPSAGSGSSR